MFIHRYYVRNTAFFLVVFYLLFGTVQGGGLPRFHYGIIKGFLTSYDFLLMMLAIWGAYALKCVSFVLKTMALPHYALVYETWGVLPLARQRRIAAWIQVSIYAPVLVYNGVAAVIALREGYILPVIITGVFNMVVCLVAVLLYSRRLLHADLEAATPRWLRWLNGHWRKPSWLYYPFELVIRQPRMVWTTKAASFAILMLTFHFMEDARFDPRALMLGVLVMVLLHSIIIFRYRYFEDLYLTFMRNLPIPIARRYGQLWLTYAVLLLPEFILLGVHTARVGAFLDMWMVVSYSIALCMLLHSLLLYPRLGEEGYTRWVFGIFFIVLFMVLGHQTLCCLVLLLVATILVFVRQFPRYEPLMEEEIKE
ncbi:hypothetical protein DCM91_02020 [Chitinophaga costaii]|nr:hypothetical protein DCM91_02020 [Chitinophaga costaii]